MHPFPQLRCHFDCIMCLPHSPTWMPCPPLLALCPLLPQRENSHCQSSARASSPLHVRPSSLVQAPHPVPTPLAPHYRSSTAGFSTIRPTLSSSHLLQPYPSPGPSQSRRNQTSLVVFTATPSHVSLDESHALPEPQFPTVTSAVSWRWHEGEWRGRRPRRSVQHGIAPPPCTFEKLSLSTSHRLLHHFTSLWDSLHLVSSP